MPEERDEFDEKGMFIRKDRLFLGCKQRLVSDKLEGGKLLYNVRLCVLMGRVYIHRNDSGYLFNAKPMHSVKKQRNRIDHGHVYGINTFLKSSNLSYFQ